MKRYVSNLVPPQYRVLPDYFKEQAENEPTLSLSVGNTLWNVFAIILIIMALMVFSLYAVFSLALIGLAFFSSSWGQRQLEQTLQFRFTTVLKTGVLCTLLLPVSLTGSTYKKLFDQAAEKKRLIELAEQKAITESKRKEVVRLDSLRLYLSQADVLLKKNAFAKAIRLYSQSTRFLTDKEPEQQWQLHAGLATSYTRMKAYPLAIKEYDELTSQGTLTNEQSYQLALCYQQVGRKTEALSELFKASEAGYSPATKLYDKLNPLLRKLLYYQTVCCDGSDSPSNAKGRGACSHHGGVCNWNKPIYQTYRKYDANGL